MYTYRTDITAKPHLGRNATAVAVNSAGDLVAICVYMGAPGGGYLPCFVNAWLIDAQGDVQSDVFNMAIETSASHNVSGQQATELGGARITKALHDMVMGVENPDIPLQESHRMSCSINERIALAKLSGEIVDLNESGMV